LNVLNAFNVFKRLKCTLRRFKCTLRRFECFRCLRQGSRLSFTHTHSSCWLAHPLYARAIREKSVTQIFNHLQSIDSRCSDTEVCSLMFLARWFDRRSANGCEGAPLFSLFQVLMVAQGGGLQQRRWSPWYVGLSYARSTIWSTGGNSCLYH